MTSTTPLRPEAGPTTLTLDERITGALVGAAVGDALGGPVEGRSPEQIVARHGGRIDGIVGPWDGENWRTARPIAPYHKGDGHVTDDTLMTHALVRVYGTVRDHLDAYAVAGHLVPELISGPRWIPELEAEALPLQRIFLAEKWIVARLHYGHVDPREAGNGNIVNCGAAMYMAPVGLVNAAHPEAAYAEALDVAGAHQSSYGREAAGVFAAAVAAACAPGATPATVVDTCLSLAKDGTRSAIEAVCEVAAEQSDFESALVPLRAAVTPSTRSAPTTAPRPSAPAGVPAACHRGASDRARDAARRGWRLPAHGPRLGQLRPGLRLDRHDERRPRGALHGERAIPADWVQTVAGASRLDLHAPARTLADVAREVFVRDTARRRAHESAFASLAGTP